MGHAGACWAQPRDRGLNRFACIWAKLRHDIFGNMNISEAGDRIWTGLGTTLCVTAFLRIIDGDVGIES